MLPALPSPNPERLAAVIVPSDADLVDEFLRRLTANTRRGYDGDLRDFARFVGETSPEAAVGVLVASGPGLANRIALGYKIALADRGLAPSTIARRLAALRSILSLARERGQIVWALTVRSPKAIAYRDTRGPGDDGWTAMRLLAKNDTDGVTRTPTGRWRATYRDRAMLRLSHDLGLRVSELVGFDLGDLEFEGDLPTAAWALRKGKTERLRLSIPEPTGRSLAEWLVVRGADPGPLFLRLNTARTKPTRITDRSVRRIVGKIGRRAGLARPVTPHGLRHHAISAVLERNGGDVVKAQEFSGHANLQTLCVYLDHLKDHSGEMARLIADDDG
jgi:integrase/recombinase XerC